MSKFSDETLICSGCNQPFTFTAGEQEFYERKGFIEKPKRCQPCREKRKAAIIEATQGQARRERYRAEDQNGERRRPRQRGVILTELLVGLALLFLIASCAAELRGYSARYSAGGAELSATVQGPVDALGARDALRAAGARAATCESWDVTVSETKCPTPKEDGKPLVCTITGWLSCGGGR